MVVGFGSLFSISVLASLFFSEGVGDKKREKCLLVHSPTSELGVELKRSTKDESKRTK